METAVPDNDITQERTGQGIGCPGWNFLYHTLSCCLDREAENIVVETGTNWGFSTITMARALIDSGLRGHVYSWETDAANHQRACDNIASAGVASQVTLYHGSVAEGLGRFAVELDGSIRFAFLDGSHQQDEVLREFTIVYPKLTNDSVVLFDNTYPLPGDNDPGQGTNGALRVIERDYQGNLVNFPHTSWWTPGQAVWQKAPFGWDWCEAC
ncbi:MAG: class I SAM-dependent methyltransferase [Lentisphaeria bacterium]|jgi:predicted O-methyltransferase YrrM|nr:class I SAM-dependent methyltransferase [Lentisphaeria bacterium]